MSSYAEGDELILERPTSRVGEEPRTIEGEVIDTTSRTVTVETENGSEMVFSSSTKNRWGKSGTMNPYNWKIKGWVRKFGIFEESKLARPGDESLVEGGFDTKEEAEKRQMEMVDNSSGYHTRDLESNAADYYVKSYLPKNYRI